ncbi:MAG: hypothetical protein KC635_22105 [Myxococcales bacterium]|nr:hypothetical protein [Myxococcales bacterium]MCB9733377.1 hypothetical protein [Deltaproteobacteria bacterium]
MSPRRAGAWLLEALLASAFTFVVGLALGYVSRGFFVVGLLEVGLGLAAGAGVAVLALTTGGPWRAPARAAAVVAVLVGFAAFQFTEDQRFQDLFGEHVAEQRAVGDALPPELLDEEAVKLLAKSAGEQLARQVRRDTGHDGFVGRFLYRAKRGIRLIGPMDSGRGLAVGLELSLAWMVVELALAGLVAHAVIRRVERRLTAVAAASPGDEAAEEPPVAT